MVAENDYRIRLRVFEGPLDLLLFLIKKSELDIYDIPIESVTRQYLDALYAMEELQLELAGEFFVMAATLMEIKSRMLLPKEQRAVDTESDDEDMDPRWELVHQLIQYKKFKEAAGLIDARIAFRQNLFDHPPAVALESRERPLRSADRIEIWNAFNTVLRRLSERLVVGEINDDHVTVVDQMEFLLEKVKAESAFVFSRLFPEKVTLRTLIATFLAVLELVRLRRLQVCQDEAFGDITCTAHEPIELENPPPLGTLEA